MDKIKLPFWMSGVELSKLVAAAQVFWEKVEGWMGLPLTKWDALTCHEDILYLMAWQRDLARFAGEPLSLFRLRVKDAFANARDGGETAGFVRIFDRLNIPLLSINEWVDGQDLDIVFLELSDSVIQSNHELLQHIVRHYGRTCRRYALQSGSHALATVAAGEASWEGLTVSAALNDNPQTICYAAVGEMSCDYVTIGASV